MPGIVVRWPAAVDPLNGLFQQPAKVQAVRTPAEATAKVGGATIDLELVETMGLTDFDDSSTIHKFQRASSSFHNLRQPAPKAEPGTNENRPDLFWPENPKS